MSHSRGIDNCETLGWRPEWRRTLTVMSVWADTMPVRCLGVDVAIKSADPAVAVEVRRAWRDAEVQTVGDDSIVVTLGEATDCDVRATDVAQALHQLSPIVTQRVIEARVGALMMWHAAALADPATGATAVLIAPSGTGKTTASRTLGKYFVYLSDETAGIELDGTIAPYRKPLSIIEGSPIKTQVAPSELGLNVDDVTGRLAAVVLLERSPGHPDQPTVTPLDTIDALAAITPEASYLARTERPLHRMADLLHMSGGAFRVSYREAASLKDVLADLLASR